MVGTALERLCPHYDLSTSLLSMFTNSLIGSRWSWFQRMPSGRFLPGPDGAYGCCSRRGTRTARWRSDRDCRRWHDDVLVEGSPEAFDFAIGLRPIGPGVAVFDAEFEQHGLERMLVRLGAG